MVKNSFKINIKNIGLYFFSFLFVASLFLALAPSVKVHAQSGTSFQAGQIIDNSVFTDTSTMSIAQIQDFLNSQENCDTNGTQSVSYYYDSSTGEVSSANFSGASYVTTTRAYYGQLYDTYNNTNIGAAPYVCLNGYIENPSTGQNNLQNPSASISGGESAAEIIYNAAISNQINPEVLITTLQKEQGLVTDNWPWLNEYQEAMGFNCPDSSGCSGYVGFYQQVSSAAAQFRNYLNNPQDFTYMVGNNTIPYSTANCGSSVVDIQNTATAALYDYTPYQPDTNVLTNTNPTGSSSGPGQASGDSCPLPAYGNRNFWWYFNTWFGSSINSNLPGCIPATNTSLTCVWDLSNPTNNDQYLTSSISTRDELFTTQDYQYNGVDFYGNVIEEPGNIPVYRAAIDGAGSFLTTSITEYNSLIAAGYTGYGVDFYADPPNTNDGFPVYRLYNASTGQHYWTGDINEYNTLLSEGWVSEGIPFNSIDTIRQETPPPPGMNLVYRFYIPQTYEHFWTTNLAERDSMISAGYDYEGVAWDSSQNTSLTPVYRLYAPSIRLHLFTSSINEYNTLLASGAWNNEGIAMYMTSTPNSNPVYRLYAPSLGVHLLTLSYNEYTTLLSEGTWNNEGIAFYVPSQ